MGVLRSTQSLQAEVDELRAALLAGGGHEAAGGWRRSAGHADAKRSPGGDAGGAAARAVCVTGGISFVGFAVVDRLLRHGYTVRLALETQGIYPDVVLPHYYLGGTYPSASLSPGRSLSLPFAPSSGSGLWPWPWSGCRVLGSAR
jgi:hypothetical protein